MKYLILNVTAILFITNVAAQKKHTIFFNSYNSLGFIAGKLPVTFTAQTENGIKFKNWFIGGGFGIDNYFIKTLPLFGSVKKDFSFKKSSLYLYCNAGGNFIAKDKKVTAAFSTIETRGGFYADAGVGYKVIITKRGSIYFSLGNSTKTVKQTESSNDSGFPYFFATENKFSRIVFRVGCQF